MYKQYYIELPQLNSLLSKLKNRFKIFAPQVKDSKDKQIDYYYQQLGGNEPFVFNAYRAIEPLKAFFTPACGKVSSYFSAEKNITDIGEKVIIFGVKNCDLAGHKIQDYVFLEGQEIDSLYRLKRENTLLISGDCTDFKPVCHCLAWDILPYAESGFDLNLSPLNDGYIVDVGSRKGQAFISENERYFLAVKETQLSARKVKREALLDKLKRHILAQDLVSKDSVQKLVKDGYNADTWQKFALTCVECGGCNLICDTCHCFLLADKKEDFTNAKLRLWDSCLYANYARVAGGANPMKLRAQRLRNRFMKKFDFFVENLAMPACCGCGRCIEVCIGKIDIREVLKDLAKKISLNDK